MPTWYITGKPAYLATRRDIGRTYREVIGRHYPPMSLLVVAALLEDRARRRSVSYQLRARWAATQ